MLSKNSFYGLFSDAELILLLQKGDETAFEEVYERYWKKLYNDTYKRLRDPEQIEEIVQDVFTDLWVKRTTKQIEQLYPYLLGAVRFQIFALYKKGKSLPFFEEPLENMAEATLQADSLLYEKELKGCIEVWLSMQPEKRREIFRLRYMEDLSTREISELLNISQKTVQNQLLTSFKSLREFLTKYMVLLTLL